jgi:hypothetical protein
MTDLVRLEHLKDPDLPARVADFFGRPMGAIYADDLDDWAWLLEHLDGWLTNASPATCNDYAAFVADRFGPVGGPTLAEVCWMLGAMCFRMRVLASGEGS